MEKRLTGRIAPERIRLMTTPRPPDGAVERFLAIGDPTGLVSDAMDELGIAFGVISASVLKPTIPGTTMVGPARSKALAMASTAWESSRRIILPTRAMCW